MLPIRVEIIDTNVAPEFDDSVEREDARERSPKAQWLARQLHTLTARTDEDGDTAELAAT